MILKMMSVDVDGRIYACHGCFYTSKKEDHLMGLLTDDFSVLEESQNDIMNVTKTLQKNAKIV